MKPIWIFWCTGDDRLSIVALGKTTSYVSIFVYISSIFRKSVIIADDSRWLQRMLERDSTSPSDWDDVFMAISGFAPNFCRSAEFSAHMLKERTNPEKRPLNFHTIRNLLGRQFRDENDPIFNRAA